MPITIRDEEDFKPLEKLSSMLLSVLLQSGYQKEPWKNSVVLQFLKDKSLLKGKENLRDMLDNVSIFELFAIYVVNTLVPYYDKNFKSFCLEAVSVEMQLKSDQDKPLDNKVDNVVGITVDNTVQETAISNIKYLIYYQMIILSSRWEKEPNNFSLIQSDLKIYFDMAHKMIASDECEELLKKIINSFKIIFHTYHAFKNYRLDLLNGQRVFESYLGPTDLNESLLVLEQLGRNLEGIPEHEWPNYGDIQNEVVTLGLDWMEQGHPSFIFGANPFYRALFQSRSQLTSRYITERIAEHLFSHPISESQDIRSKLQIVLKEFDQLAEMCHQKTYQELIDVFIKKLKILRKKYLKEHPWSSGDIYDWCFGLILVLSVQDHYLLEFKRNENKSENKAEKEIESLTTWIDGDSVPAGVGVLHADRHQRCIPRMTQLVNEDHTKFSKDKVQVINFSVPGRTTMHGAGEIGEKLKLHAPHRLPDVIAVTLGGNNIFRKDEDDEEEIATAIEEDMVNYVNEVLKYSKQHSHPIFILWILDVPDTFLNAAGWRRKLALVMSNVRERTKNTTTGQYTVHTVLDETGLLKVDYMIKDHDPLELLHPNAEGHEAIAQCNKKILLDILARKTKQSAESRCSSIGGLGAEVTLELPMMSAESYAGPGPGAPNADIGFNIAVAFKESDNETENREKRDRNFLPAMRRRSLQMDLQAKNAGRTSESSIFRPLNMRRKTSGNNGA